MLPIMRIDVWLFIYLVPIGSLGYSSSLFFRNAIPPVGLQLRVLKSLSETMYWPTFEHHG